MKDKSIWEHIGSNLLFHIGSVLFFAAITVIYFLPQFQGKELRQSDQTLWKGMAQETIEYHEKSGNNVVWCGSMFSGMPGYTVSIRHNYPNAINWVEAPFRALDYHTAGIILLALVCGYIFFCVLGCSVPIAILGAVAFAFSSYFPIIIEAGHVTKGWVMASMPLVLAGLTLAFRRKWIAGGLLFTFALTENIRHGHIQITYYLFLLCLFLYIGYLINKVRSKDTKTLLTASGVLLAGGLVALIMNSALLYSNFELSKSSIRGKSELTSAVDGKQDKSSGLDQDYAFAWSYGKAETLTLLVPNLYGGGSGGVLEKDSNLGKVLKKNGQPVPKELHSYTYWGDQPFTSGPVYFGSIICFLFVLSLFIVQKKYKWWIVAASAFLIFMSWGRNFSLLNDFLFHHLPFYNKFRTPSMALVIPQITFVWLACLALKEIYDNKVETQKLKTYLYVSGAITGGLCLIFALFPSLFFSFESANDAQLEGQLPDWYISALMLDRADLLSSDAWRSFWFILAAFGILLAYTFVKSKEKFIVWGAAAIALLTFIDLWSVDKRYLNESKFVKSSKNKEFVESEADKFILQDISASYRVLTLNNPFNDSKTSYFHKSIGGYNAAKLRRYQDLYDLHIEKEMGAIIGYLRQAKTMSEADSSILKASTPILDMLNMKYLIFNPDMPAATNHGANGNVWFVQDVRYVDNADEEMKALDVINPKTSAVVDKSFAGIIQECTMERDSSATIELISYEPIHLKYVSDSKQDNVALFSEIYYKPGWKAFIDGKEVEHFRANWVLRGLSIPAGKHDIEFKFEPDTYWNLTLLGTIGSFILVGLIIALCVLQFLKQKKAIANS